MGCSCAGEAEAFVFGDESFDEFCAGHPLGHTKAVAVLFGVRVAHRSLVES